MMDKKPMKCQHCGHEWMTDSKLRFVTCAICDYKTKNRNYIEGYQKPKPKSLRCKKCDYIMHTRSKRILVTCPSCRLNTPNTTLKE